MEAHFRNRADPPLERELGLAPLERHRLKTFLIFLQTTLVLARRIKNVLQVKHLDEYQFHVCCFAIKLKVLDPCSSYPCHNGGTCTDLGDYVFTCKCAEGYAGQHCQLGKKLILCLFQLYTD